MLVSACVYAYSSPFKLLVSFFAIQIGQRSLHCKAHTHFNQVKQKMGFIDLESWKSVVNVW